jgi:undecaprenyl-phosphate 4-deoxy-4-formamido-L-arabinose transferase
MLNLSVVIPVYRAAKSLPELYRRLTAVLERHPGGFEILFVEDCGGDNSWEVICQLAAEDPRIKGIQLSRNFGQHAATICGFAHARGDWVATIDDDLEQPPECLLDLYYKAMEGYTLVYGIYPQRSHKAWRNITSNIARWLFRKAIPSLNHEYTSYRLIWGDIARAMTQFDSPFPFVDGYLSWLTSNYATVEVSHSARAHGDSNYTFKKLFIHTINIFATFSDLPLRIATWIGLMTFMSGMVWLAVILGGKLLGGITVSGYASIMAAILLFGGVQLLMLGIFGEYLGRMNFKSSKKPLFLVGRTTDSLSKYD